MSFNDYLKEKHPNVFNGMINQKLVKEEKELSFWLLVEAYAKKNHKKKRAKENCQNVSKCIVQLKEQEKKADI